MAMDSTKGKETNDKPSEEMEVDKPDEEPPTPPETKAKKRIEIRIEFPILFDDKNDRPMTAIEETRRLHRMLFENHKDKIIYITHGLLD